MLPWMLEAPQVKLPESALSAFQAAWDARDPARLPGGVPRWLFLQWLAAQGYLLHGSKRADITLFEPRLPHDLGPDEFSKRAGVFASSDGLWAMMFALKDRERSSRILSCAIQVREGRNWSRMRYFLSFAPRDPAHTPQPPPEGRALMSPGCVYVLPSADFEQAPPYQWPGVGEVLEAQWLHAGPVRPLLCVPVQPDDFPLPVRVHDAARVDALCYSDPWGFPWLEGA